MEIITSLATYFTIAVIIALVVFFGSYYISAFFRVYIVFHTYLDDKKIVIHKDLEDQILKELNQKYPFKSSLSLIRLEIINEMEHKIMDSIKKEYEDEIHENIIGYKK